jgi:hypothetical protein
MPQATWQIEDVSDLLLLILRANSSLGLPRLSGVTRLQKLVFLTTRDSRYTDLVRRGIAPDVDFEPYKMGPFTPDIYEAVETLATFRPQLLEATAESSGVDALEAARYVEELDLDSRQASGSRPPRPMEYRLTESGKRVADALWADAPPELQEAVQDVLHQYGRLPLRELLRRVYVAHPDMTVRSEIKRDLGLQ